MSPAAILICSSAVGEYNISENNKFFSSTGIGDPYFQPFDGSSDAGAAEGVSRPFSPTANIDSSMSLVAVVVVTGILCVLLRRRRPLPRASEPKGGPRSLRRRNPAAGGLRHGRGAPGERRLLNLPERVRGGETVKLIPHCGHVFHAACVDTWLSTHVTCPLCRSAQLFNVADVAGGLSGCDAAAQV